VTRDLPRGWLDPLFDYFVELLGAVDRWLRAWDWTQFLPDVVVALFIGLGVGLVLLVAQWTRETSASRRESRNGVARLIHPLLLELQRAGDDHRYDRLDKPSRRREAALQMIERSDIEIWHERRPTRLSVAILGYRNACWSQIVQGKELDAGIARWCREHATDERTYEFAVAKSKGANHRDLRTLFTPNEWARVTSDYSQLAVSRRFTKPARGFRAKVGRATDREHELRQLLVEAIKKRRAARSSKRSLKRLY
jgi:hypothetical protein